MERTEIFILIFFFIKFCENVSTIEASCMEVTQTESVTIGSDNTTLSRVKRGFGGQEPINFTLVNSQILGPPGANFTNILRAARFV